MSTTITLRIQDTGAKTWVKNPNHKAGDPFPKLPWSDLPQHPPFELVLQWSMLPGADPWTANACTGLLPVDNGVWQVVNTGDDPENWGSHIAIKTGKDAGAKGFLFL